MKRKQSVTPRSLKMLRDAGWTAEKTEHWQQHPGILKDLFGFGDILAIRKGYPHLIVQTTTAAHVANRIAKIVSIPAARVWLETHGEIVCHSWDKRVGDRPRGSRKLWSVVERPVRLEDFQDQDAPERPVDETGEAGP